MLVRLMLLEWKCLWNPPLPSGPGTLRRLFIPAHPTGHFLDVYFFSFAFHLLYHLVLFGHAGCWDIKNNEVWLFPSSSWIFLLTTVCTLIKWGFFSLDLWKKRVSYLPSLLHVHFLPFGDRLLNLTADCVPFLLSFWNVEIITMSNSLFSSRSTMKRCLYRESTYLSSRIQLSETGSIQAQGIDFSFSSLPPFLFLLPVSCPTPPPSL